MKDRFSQHSEDYKKYRPSYPDELYTFIFQLLSSTEQAWDCGTGNGQVAFVLAEYFKQVFATDISEKQLAQAAVLPNITYKVERAEQTSFPPHSFDLITVAQAIHWFDFDAFYKEVKRTLKPKGLLVVMGYGLMQTAAPIQQIIEHFYTHTIGPYWDKERVYIDEGYTTIPFPFKEIQAPSFHNKIEWTLPQLMGYLHTWSAVKRYEQKGHINPLSFIEKDLKENWGEEITQSIVFPMLLRIGTV